MKKRTKSKTPKPSSKKKTGGGHELLELVSVMAKVAERLEALERKMDVVLNRLAHRSSEAKPAFHNIERPEPIHHASPHPPSRHGHDRHRGRDGRMLHKAVCADCHKPCEIPFKPSGNRSVYCKDCFAKRRNGNFQPTNVTRTFAPNQDHYAKPVSGFEERPAAPQNAMPFERSKLPKKKKSSHPKKVKR